MHSANCTEARRFHSAVRGYGVDAPVVLQRQVHGSGRAMLGSTVVTCSASAPGRNLEEFTAFST